MCFIFVVTTKQQQGSVNRQTMKKMIRFIKHNWFPIAVLILLLAALLQRSGMLRPSPDLPPVQQGQQGSGLKYTASIKEKARDAMSLFEGEISLKKLPEISEAEAEAYLRRFSKVAMDESDKFGIPASILLAHSYVNSFAGKRDIALKANNFSGLECSSNWDKAKYVSGSHCYREYSSPWQSFRDLSLYLVKQPWVHGTKESSGLDSEAWIKAFSKNQMSDVKEYEQEMAEIIRAFRLFELDE